MAGPPAAARASCESVLIETKRTEVAPASEGACKFHRSQIQCGMNEPRSPCSGCGPGTLAGVLVFYRETFQPLRHSARDRSLELA